MNSCPFVSLGDVATIATGTTNPGRRPETTFQLYSIPGFDAGKTPDICLGEEIKSSKTVMPQRAVLFSKLNPRINRVWTIKDGEGARICSTEFVPLVPDEDKLDIDFLAWRLQVPWIAAELPVGTAAATKSRERIRPNTLLQLKMPLPPLEEQRRIVDILNRAASIERLRARASTQLRALIPALFIRMFGGAHEIAERFTTRPLKAVASIGSGATKGRKIDPNGAIDVPYLRVANVQDGFLNLDEIKTITIRAGEEQKYALEPGDLVMTEGGDPDKLGRAAIWRGEIPYCAHQNHVFRVRPDGRQVLSDYLRAVVGSKYGKAYFLRVAKQTTGIASINKTQLGNFPVPVPPMELQERFAALVDRISAAERLLERSASEAQALSRALMSRLFDPSAGDELKSMPQTEHAAE